MEQEVSFENVRHSIVDTKDHGKRKFKHLTNNFYIIKSAIRYFAVKKGISFNSSKISKNFPIAATVSGSAMSALEEIGVVEPRNNSSSSSRYMPQDVDLGLLEEVEEILAENHEIREFKG